MARLQFGAAFCLALWWSSGVQATQIHNNPIACAVGCLNEFKGEFTSQHQDPYVGGCKGPFPNDIACCILKSCPEDQWPMFCGKDNHMNVPDKQKCFA
ncbi:ATP-dependent DNA helicase PIF1 [Metarhizium brunneum]